MIWEKQPWETPAAFARFAAYYLAQTPPRSALEAYRRYLQEERGVKIGQKKSVKNLSGRWQCWVQGHDGRGQPIPGAVGWRERADAFDAHQNRIAHERRQQELADRMRAYDESAMRVVERGIKVVETMLQFPLQETVTEKDGQAIIIKPARWSMDTAAKLVPALDKLYRLLYSLPTETIDATTRIQPGYEHLNDAQLDDELTAYMERLAQAGAREIPEFAQGEGGEGAGVGSDQGADSGGDHATGRG